MSKSKVYDIFDFMYQKGEKNRLDPSVPDNNNIARTIAKDGMHAAGIMTIADIATQLLVERRVFTMQKFGNEKEEDNVELDDISHYDPIRTQRWTLHGLYFFLEHLAN